MPNFAAQDGTATGEKGKLQPRRPTDKGALFYKCSHDVHEWLTHLRHVHAGNPSVTIFGKVVKASNQFAAPGESLDAYTIFTARLPITTCNRQSLNDFFFQFWNMCFGKTFRLVCPFYDFTSTKDFQDLFAAKVPMYAVVI